MHMMYWVGHYLAFLASCCVTWLCRPSHLLGPLHYEHFASRHQHYLVYILIPRAYRVPSTELNKYLWNKQIEIVVMKNYFKIIKKLKLVRVVEFAI